MKMKMTNIPYITPIRGINNCRIFLLNANDKTGCDDNMMITALTGKMGANQVNKVHNCLETRVAS